MSSGAPGCNTADVYAGKAKSGDVSSGGCGWARAGKGSVYMDFDESAEKSSLMRKSFFLWLIMSYINLFMNEV